MNAALAYQWDGTPIDVFFEVITGSYDRYLMLVFLDRLRQQFPKRRIILLWDGLAAHQTKLIQDYLADHPQITVVRFPPYCPDLNPTEFLWGNLKGSELANYVPDGLYDLAVRARDGIERIRNADSLLEGFVKAAGLSF